jgi:DNA-binding transcriptional LysR family regulator
MYRELFNRKGLTLERLQALVKVADASSLIEAAEHRPVVQSLYSRQLRELENFFGCALTKRSGKTLVMSEAGLRLAKLSRLYLAGLNDFLQEQQHRCGPVRVGAGERIIHWLIAPHLLPLRQRPDSMTLEFHNLRSADMVTKLHHHELDLGIVRSERPPPRPLKAVRLGVLRYAYFATEEHCPRKKTGGAHRKPVTFADINDTSRRRTHAKIVEMLFGIPLAPAYLCHHMPALARIVQSGAAGALLPVHAAGEFGKTGVQSIRLDHQLPIHETLWMTWNPRMVELVPAIERVMRMMKELVAARLD